MAAPAFGSVEGELAKERTFGGDGLTGARDIHIIDLSDPNTT
jgi:hypothetical protein